MKKPAKKFKIIVIFCLFFLFLSWLMINFAFPDLFAMFYVPNLIDQGNIYSLVKAGKNQCLWLDSTFPPLYYLVVGAYLKIIQFLRFIPQNIFTSSACPIMTLLTNQQFLFWAKFPFLVCLILAGFIFRELTHKNNDYLNLFFWITNPILIFVSLIEGQFEIMPILFCLYSFLLFKQQKFIPSYLSLGIAGALKHFPFLWLPAFLIFTPLKWPKKISLAALSALPYLIAIMFQFNTDILYMFQFSENTKMLRLGLQLGPQLKISYYLVGYLLILFRASRQKINFKNFFETNFLLALIYFLTTQWYSQRILWVLPFIIILSLSRPIYRSINRIINFIYFGYTLIIYPAIFDFELTRPNFYQKLIRIKQVIPLNKNLSQTLIGSLMWTTLLLSGIFIFVKEKRGHHQPLSKLDLSLNLIPLLLYLAYIFSPWQLVLE